MSGEPGSESPTTPGASTSQPSGALPRPRGLRTLVSISAGLLLCMLLLWYAGAALGLRLPGSRSRVRVQSNPGVSTQELLASVHMLTLCNIYKDTDFVLIENQGQRPYSMAGWVLQDKRGAEELPEHSLQPGHVARVWRRRADLSKPARKWLYQIDRTLVDEIELRSWTRRWDWEDPGGVVLQLADGTQIAPQYRGLTCDLAK